MTHNLINIVYTLIPTIILSITFKLRFKNYTYYHCCYIIIIHIIYLASNHEYMHVSVFNTRTKYIPLFVFSLKTSPY